MKPAALRSVRLVIRVKGGSAAESMRGNDHRHMLTVVGADQPGIVAKLTEALFRGGCNLGEASMARLDGSFSVMLLVAASPRSTTYNLSLRTAH
jgi:predicted amino acid-binding ACT domain protein